MSRIDDALKAWEAQAPGTTADDSKKQASPLFHINQYPREGAVPAASERASERVNGHAYKPAEPVVTVVTPDAWHPAPELEARLVTGRTVSNAVIEQYRRLAAALHDLQVTRQLKTVMVTSALPGDGKTLTIVNLALTLSESYARRCLLIDADFRSPSMHNLLRISNDRGLNDALLKPAEPLPIRQLSPTLSVLTTGPVGSSPLAGLSSPRMQAVIQECAATFDWVLIDTPPVGVMPDAQLLARLTGAVVFVIGAGVTPGDLVERAIAELGPEYVLGPVLNRVENSSIPEIGYYDYYRARHARESTGADRS